MTNRIEIQQKSMEDERSRWERVANSESVVEFLWRWADYLEPAVSERRELMIRRLRQAAAMLEMR